MTNADRIREMSDSELALFLFSIDKYTDTGTPTMRLDLREESIKVMDSFEELLEWLESEVADENL